MAEAALENYEFEPIEVTPVRFTNNAVFRVETTKSEYALRIHRPGFRTPEQTRSELIYMAGLGTGGGVSVPVPIHTQAGDLVALFEVDGKGRHASVVTWLKGKVRRPGQGAGSETLYRIGQALGRIHRFSETFEPPAGFDLPTWDVDALFTPGQMDLSETLTQRRMFGDVCKRVAEVLDDQNRSPATFGVLHHDFILLNCLHNGRRTSVIDFDDCGWGVYLQDLGGLLGNLKDYPNYWTLRKPFLDGYRSERPLPSEAEQDLELMIALRHCISALWLLERHQQGGVAGDQYQRIMAYRLGEIESSLRSLQG